MLPALTVYLLVLAFFMLAVGYLLYVHTVNFMKGKTTMERYGKSSDDLDD